MAKNVSVKIGSKFDKRGVNEAKQGLKQLPDSAKQSADAIAQRMATATAAVAAMAAAVGKAIQVWNKFHQIYLEQAKAESRLQAAARNNPYINGEGVRRLKDFASEIQRSTRGLFGDEVILQQEQFLVGLQLTEDQIRNLTLAAVDFAASGTVSLDAAVRNLAKTYSGLQGELGELIPAVRELTAEQLKAGEAIDVVAKQYKGMAEDALPEAAQAIQDMRATWSDLAEDVGEALTKWFAPTATILNNIGEALQRADTQASNFGNTLEDLSRLDVFTSGKQDEWAREQVQLMLDLYSRLDEEFNLSDVIMEPGKEKNDLLNFLELVGLSYDELLKKLRAGEAVGPFDFTDEMASRFVDMLDTMGVKLDDVVGDAGATVEEQLGENKWKVIRIQMEEQLSQAMAQIDASTGAVEELFGVTVDDMAEKAEVLEEALLALAEKGFKRGQGGAIDYLIGKYEEVFEYLRRLRGEVEETTDVLSEPPATRVSARNLAGGSVSQPAMTELEATFARLEKALGLDKLTRGEPGGPGERELLGPIIMEAIRSGLGDVAARSGPEGERETVGEELLIGALSGMTDIVNNLKDGFGFLFDGVMEAVGSFASILKIMSPWQTILQAIIKVLEPVVNDLLAPIVGILEILGQTIGLMLVPVLQALEPIITTVTELFVWLYNALLPVFNFLINAFTTITATLSWAVLKIKSWFTLAADDPGSIGAYIRDALSNVQQLEAIDLEQVRAAGEESIADSGGALPEGSTISGGSTTVQRPPDINQYIYFQGPVLGDGGVEEVAEEIAAAFESLGYSGADVTLNLSGASEE